MSWELIEHSVSSIERQLACRCWQIHSNQWFIHWALLVEDLNWSYAADHLVKSHYCTLILHWIVEISFKSHERRSYFDTALRTVIELCDVDWNHHTSCLWSTTSLLLLEMSSWLRFSFEMLCVWSLFHRLNFSHMQSSILR